MATTTTGLRDSTSILGDRGALLARAADDGYLFFRDLLPRARVLELREDILGICRAHGWVKEGTALADGIADADAADRIDPQEIAFCGVGIPRRAYEEVQRLESFHALAHAPALIELYGSLFNTDALPHPRHIARVMLPTRTNVPTPPHQDYIHIQGTKNVWTAWIPIGDVSRSLGGLSVLKGSQRDGLLPVKAAEGAGSLEVYLCNVDLEWLEEDYRAGDVLTFTSLTVHRSIPNRQPDRIRLSCDFRYQPANEPIEARSLATHCDVLSWEEVYEGWTNRDLMYYWKRYDLAIADWDESIRWQKEKIC